MNLTSTCFRDFNDNQLIYAVEECSNYNHIISWRIKEPDEHHLVITDVHEFTAKILPALFKVAKYDSFQRKLYRWGFVKARRSKVEREKYPNQVSYFHKSFRKGNYSLAAQMTCSGMEVELYKNEQKKNRKRNQQNEDTTAEASTTSSNIDEESDLQLTKGTNDDLELKNIHDLQFLQEFPNYGSSYASSYANTMPATSFHNGSTGTSYSGFDNFLHNARHQKKPVSDMNDISNAIKRINQECKKGLSISSTHDLDHDIFLRIEDLADSPISNRKELNKHEQQQDEDLALFHQLRENIAKRQSWINSKQKDILKDPWNK